MTRRHGVEHGVLHTRRILLSEHDFSSQRARSSKEVTEADAFLCDLDPNLCALCVSTPLLWLRSAATGQKRHICWVSRSFSPRRCLERRLGAGLRFALREISSRCRKQRCTITAAQGLRPRGSGGRQLVCLQNSDFPGHGRDAHATRHGRQSWHGRPARGLGLDTNGRWCCSPSPGSP